MARVGGRNSWIAVPAGLICAGVVAGLVWLALPMVPVTVQWMGDTLRRASTPAPAITPKDTPAQRAAAGEDVDCRTLYADDLWNELMWRPGSQLGQTASSPLTDTAFADAVSPDVVVSCEWRFDEGAIVTTLSRVDADAAAIAQAALSGEGFVCDGDAARLVCSRSTGSVREDHSLRDGLWLASTQTQWQPEDYAARVDRNVWG